jgi:hypothetical protein
LDTFFSVRKIVPDEILKAMVRDGIVGPDAQLKFIDNNDQCDNDVFLFRVSTHLECSYCHFNSYVFEFSRREMRLRAKCVTCDCLRRHTVIEWTLVLNPDTDSWVEAENKKECSEQDACFGVHIPSEVVVQAKKRMLELCWMSRDMEILEAKQGNNGDGVLFLNFGWNKRMRCPLCGMFLFYAVHIARNLLSRTCPSKTCANHYWKRNGFATVCDFYC